MEPYATIEVITPAKAAEYLKHNKHNRPVNQKQVEFLAKQMQQGKWKLNGEGISFLANGELGDGQHRLEAIIMADVPVQIVVTRGADDDSFPTYDSGRNRSASDCFAVEDIPNYAWVSSTVQKFMRMRKGESVMTQGGNRRCATGITTAEMLAEYYTAPDTFQAAALLGRRVTSRKTLQPAVVSAMAAYLKLVKHHQWAKIEEFFTLIDSDNVTGCNSVRLLRDRLLKERVGSIKKSTPKYIKQLIIKTWNDFIVGANNRKTLRFNTESENEADFI